MQPEPSLLVIAAFSRHPQAFDWARERLKVEYGSIALESPPYAFHHTSYYEADMGTELQKRFFVFDDLAAPDSLAARKRRTIELEEELTRCGQYPERRPINLDPGFLSLGKFLLATTKDQVHRIFLRDGIFAEVTLRFQDGEYHPWPWTYADYREPFVLLFLKQAREFLKIKINERTQPT